MRRACWLLVVVSFAYAQTQPLAPTPEGLAFFEANIHPLLANNCYGCDSAQASQPMAGLRLDSRAGMLREGGRHVHDFHATILHSLGFDHTKLTFLRAGRDYRLRDMTGKVMREIVA